MKKLIMSVLFSALCLYCFAQPAFTEKTLNDISNRLMKDFNMSATDYMSPDYTFTNGEGVVLTAEQMKEAFKTAKISDWQLSDIKIKQSANLTFVTGVNKHTITALANNANFNYNTRFTYIYEYKNGKWLWLSAQHTHLMPTNYAADEVAIKKILDDVDAAFNGGDKDGVINAWKNDPKISFIGSGAGGEFNLVAQDFEGLKKAVTQYVVKPTGTKGVKSNHRFMFKGNVAIVEFDQEDMRANGTKGYSHNINIFEKVGDSWKAIVASHHSFNPKNEESPEDVAKRWLAEYNKDGKSYFENNCSEDFIASNTGINGGKFFGRETIVNRARKENETNDVETTNMKSFKSGNLAVVISNLIWHHKQADGTDKPDKTVSTMIMQKKDGKWWYVGHHISPLNE